ncbi:MAG: LLM class F420-dependent oxidoreductase, partial [Gammaproteobacteria bacterium]|nr:LLM class F420-dependent oxidoreductase [Gammaproteobacteria bacterium]
FYGSTPAYKNVLGVHGWGDMQSELNGMSKQGKWKEMGELITDEMLGTFGVMDEPGNIVAEMKSRYGDFTDRTSGGFTFVESEARLQMVAELRA